MFADTVMPSSISDLTESDGEAGFESIAATKSADEYNINTMQTSFIRTIPSVPSLQRLNHLCRNHSRLADYTADWDFHPALKFASAKI